MRFDGQGAFVVIRVERGPVDPTCWHVPATVGQTFGPALGRTNPLQLQASNHRAFFVAFSNRAPS